MSNIRITSDSSFKRILKSAGFTFPKRRKSERYKNGWTGEFLGKEYFIRILGDSELQNIPMVVEELCVEHGLAKGASIIILSDTTIPETEYKNLTEINKFGVLDNRKIGAHLALLNSENVWAKNHSTNLIPTIGHYALEGDNTYRSATITIFYDIEGSLRFSGFASRGNLRKFGPNMGMLDFLVDDLNECRLTNLLERNTEFQSFSAARLGNKIICQHVRFPFDPYQATFTFTKYGMLVEEENFLNGPFGYGVSFGGHYEKAILPSENKQQFAVSSNEIDNLSNDFKGLFRSFQVGSTEIRAWLEQFAPDERRPMFYLLKYLRFYNSLLVREAVYHLHSKLLERLSLNRGSSEGQFLLTAFGKPDKSGASLARIYKQENNLLPSNSIHFSNIRTSLPDMQEIKYILCVEDVVGSGEDMIHMLQELQESIGEYLTAQEITVAVLCICGLEDGLTALRKKMGSLPFKTLLFCFEAHEKCFAKPPEAWFADENWKEIREIALKYGKKLKPSQPLGYKDSQMLVVLHDNCPNNTLPIIWASSTQTNFYWRPLFPRE